jgi:hypothetical protein
MYKGTSLLTTLHGVRYYRAGLLSRMSEEEPLFRPRMEDAPSNRRGCVSFCLRRLSTAAEISPGAWDHERTGSPSRVTGQITASPGFSWSLFFWIRLTESHKI